MYLETDFYNGYIEALVWSSTPDGDEWDDASLAPETIERAQIECAAFMYRYECFIDAEEAQNGDHSQAGHDFALTRNGHGAGFWDGDWPVYGDMLTKGSESFGEVDLYLGDDGLIYC
jgi:hypothetical protein